MTSESEVRALLSRVETHHPPTEQERRHIEDAMWRAYGVDSEPETTMLDPDVGVIVPIPQPRQRVGLLVAIAAASVLVFIGIGVLRSPARTNITDPAVSGLDVDIPERSDTVARRFGPVTVRFDVPPGRTKERSTDNSILLGSRLREPADNGMEGRILVARVENLFGGGSMPEGAAVLSDIERQVAGGVVRSLALTVEEDVEFAAVADGGETLVLTAGAQHELDIVEFEDGTGHLLVWAIGQDGAKRTRALLPTLVVD